MSRKPASARQNASKAKAGGPASAPNLLIVAQSGRLAYEALLFTASLRHAAPGFKGRLLVAEPQPTGAWAGRDTLVPQKIRSELAALGAEIAPFTAPHFGAGYPYGNKIEALSVLPAGEPFLFFDTDTLITGALDCIDLGRTPPTASMLRSASWPEPPPYGPGFAEIWGSLYERFGLDIDATVDRRYPEDDWERYLYFNAGWFCGPDPAPFRERFLDWAVAVRDDPGDALACQSLHPWLDQIVLPLVIHSLGGGRPQGEIARLDGEVSWHYRKLPLAYATAPEPVLALLEEVAGQKPIRRQLREWDAARRMIYRREGRRLVQPLAAELWQPPENALRRQLKRADLWIN